MVISFDIGAYNVRELLFNRIKATNISLFSMTTYSANLTHLTATIHQSHDCIYYV